jgi:hypothetical protein
MIFNCHLQGYLSEGLFGMLHKANLSVYKCDQIFNPKS